MTIQELIEKKRALNQYLEEINTQIAELTPKDHLTVMGWLQWAKKNGFDWAQSAIDQCSLNYSKEKVSSIKNAVWGFYIFHETKEGSQYWDKIYMSLCAKQK